MTLVDIGIACSNHQTSDWWAPVFSNLLLENGKEGVEIGAIYAISSALPDHNKNNAIMKGPDPAWMKRRESLTDANRNRITHRFMDGKAEWLFQIDDDTVPPYGTIAKLMGMGRDFIGGLYFLPGPPNNPIAYYRQTDNFYFPIWDYPEGALLQVDAIGMGCTLIHRSVFEKIVAGHEVFMRPQGSWLIVPKKNVRNRKVMRHPFEAYVKNGVYHMPVKPKDEDDERPFPFYALEYGRTEDYHFCELADHVGSKPWLDTTIICNHFKPQATSRDQYRKSLEEGLHP